MRNFLIISLLGSVLFNPGIAFAVTEIECIAKHQGKNSSENKEAKLEGGTSSGGIFSAQVTLGTCFFNAQSLYPDKLLQLHIRDTNQGNGISSYAGYDPKGKIIFSYSKNDGDLICMVVCSKK